MAFRPGGRAVQRAVPDIDSFLAHRTSGGGLRGTEMRKWRRRAPPVLNAVLHRHVAIEPLWQHGWPRVVERDDQETGERVIQVWGGTWNCWEGEEVLVNQYKRDRDTDERLVPVQACPFCLFLDVIRGLINDEKVGWLQPIFEFKADDERDDRVLHAAAMVNMIPREPGQDELALIKRARLRRDQLWKENCMPKCRYAFVVADADDPGLGVDVLLENSILGDRVRDVIAARAKDVGRDDANPIKNPYVIQFEHRPKEREFGKKYAATGLFSRAVPPDVLELVDDPRTVPPNRDRMLARGSAAILRAQMEERCLLPNGLVDWDYVFGPSQELLGRGVPDGDNDGDVEDEDGQPGEPARAAGARTPELLGPDADSDVIPCEVCAAPMSADADRCGACGAEYSYDDPPPGAEDESLRSDGDPPPRPPAAPPPPPVDDGFPDYGGGADDDIPF